MSAWYFFPSTLNVIFQKPHMAQQGASGPENPPDFLREQKVEMETPPTLNQELFRWDTEENQDLICFSSILLKLEVTIWRGDCFEALRSCVLGQLKCINKFMAHSIWGPEEMWVACRDLRGEERSQDLE